MSTSTIAKLLDTAARSVAALPDDFYKENTSKDLQGPVVPWARSTLYPNVSTPLSVGQNAQRQMQGLYRIDILYPQDKGPSAARTAADAVVAAFPIGRRLVDGAVTVICEMASVLSSPQAPGKYYIVPVQINWVVYIG